jgi:hypothetical protein
MFFTINEQKFCLEVLKILSMNFYSEEKGVKNIL